MRLIVRLIVVVIVIVIELNSWTGTTSWRLKSARARQNVPKITHSITIPAYVIPHSGSLGPEQLRTDLDGGLHHEGHEEARIGTPMPPHIPAS